MSTRSGSQRLFFALWPEDALRERLIDVRERIDGHRGKPVHPADLHVTLVFLGKVEADEYGCVVEAAEGVEGTSFELSIDRVGYWKRPRILWCGPSHAPAGLTRLFDDLRSRLTACGFSPEKRPYAPHVTLARKSLPVVGFRLERPLHLKIREFVLVSSDNGIPSPRYQVIKKWALDS